MALSLISACLWAILANAAAMMLPPERHWRAAYGLIALGVPLVGWVTWENGPWIGLLVLAAGISVLRWPARQLWRWLVRHLAPKPPLG